MKLKSRFSLLGILLMLAIIMRIVIAANADADGDANADANAVANADAYYPILPYPDPPNPRECGQIIYRENKIVGGVEAKFGSHPWLGALFYGTLGHVCGCNLLNHKWCVTAAHCMYERYDDRPHELRPLDQFSVRFGEHDLSSTSEPLPYEEHTFEDRKIFPLYNSYQYVWDITMMKVYGGVYYDGHILPICLPKSNLNVFDRFANVAGWGMTDFDEETYPDVLREVNLRILLNSEICKYWFKLAGYTYNDHRTTFCAGYKRGEKGTCVGDSGGALTVIENGKHVVVGLVSYGENCSLPNLPPVFVRVQYFVPWILNFTST